MEGRKVNDNKPTLLHEVKVCLQNIKARSQYYDFFLTVLLTLERVKPVQPCLQRGLKSHDLPCPVTA